MKWKKVGLIFDPAMLSSRQLTCSLMPIVELVDEAHDIARVYFSPRDLSGRSQLDYFEIDLKNPSKILKTSERPLFQHGILGAFDDSGVTPGSFAMIGNRKMYYYTGWNLGQTVPFNNSIGVAEFDSKTGVFKRLGDGPIMTRTLHEPYSCASPFVMVDSQKYRMWYASMDQWKKQGEEALPVYNIKYAESNDGIHWSRNGHVVLNYEAEGEYAFGRPFVRKEKNVYQMWYSVRGAHYKIGYAESADGLRWKRMDHLAGIGASDSGWDSEMIEYPFILDHKQKKYMFYNGNGYGRSGIGLAILIE